MTEATYLLTELSIYGILVDQAILKQKWDTNIKKEKIQLNKTVRLPVYNLNSNSK